MFLRYHQGFYLIVAFYSKNKVSVFHEINHKTQDKQLIDKKIKEYGVQNFTFQIIDENDDPQIINQLEKDYIQKYNSLIPNGYNIHIGGRNNSIGEENHCAKLKEEEAQ